MIKNYTVRAPFVVRLNERDIYKAGEVVALEDRVASQHAHKLVEVIADKRKLDVRNVVGKL